ncbi:phosphatidylinositol-specific phospholipase C domain-containing protein [Pseudomonas putida]|uniref:phosphatidylinositol-specific phospholipase C domain-containing protein n=1 Tax=Pseudomonas putida TaxID=303 RepID=UPI003F32496A
MSIKLWLLALILMLSNGCVLVRQPGVDSAINAAQPGKVVDKSRPFSEYQWVMSHNSFLTSTWTGLPAQKLSIRDQLARGVRGLMLDTYNDPVELCHPEKDCRAKLVDVLNVVTTFLKDNPDAVITIHFEDYASQAAMQSAFSAVPNMAAYVFNPTVWGTRTEWPTLQQMIASNQRLILITQKKENAGRYANNVYMFLDKDITVENYWSLGDTIFDHDLSCKSRFDNIPLNTKKATHSDFNGWSRLFLMNHYHGAPLPTHSADDNEIGGRVGLVDRVDNQCKPAAGRDPNYIAVDFVEQGDVLEYVEKNNNGGVVAYEGNGLTQSLVCAFSTAFDRTINLQDSDQERLGCENDEMRSFSLSGVKKGTRITFFDSPSGDMQDDYAIVDIKRDIGRDKLLKIKTFEQNVYNDNDYHMVWVKNNGLDGKVSRIKVETSVSGDYSDAKIVLYEAENAGQNNVCTIKLDRNYSFNFPGSQGCDNDEAVSARLLKARKNTIIQFYGNWNANTCDQGCSTITVLADVDTPVTIPTFKNSWTSPDGKVKVVRSGGSQQLEGRISSARIELDPFIGKNVVPNTLSSASDGYWGSWGAISKCPAGNFVWGFRLKSEPSVDGDDTALNAVEMYCSRDTSLPIKSKEGPWGKEVKGPVFCSSGDGPVTGFQIRIEKPLDGDDTAAGNVRLICRNGRVLKLEPSAQWGEWSKTFSCPAGQSADGFVTRVEDPLDGDDTALNGMRLHCKPN